MYKRQGVGQTADDQGDDHDGHGTGEGKGLLAKSNQQGQANDSAWHNVGQHRQSIDGVVQGAGAADHQIGDEHRDHDDDDQCQDTHNGGVFNRAAQQLLGGGLVVAQREAGLEDSARAVAEGQVDNVQLGQKGHSHQHIAVQMHQETGQALGVLLFHGVQGVHGKLEAAGGELLNRCV